MDIEPGDCVPYLYFGDRDGGESFASHQFTDFLAFPQNEYLPHIIVGNSYVLHGFWFEPSQGVSFVQFLRGVTH